MPKSNRPARLAQALRDLRQSHWPGVKLTQIRLAEVLSTERKVAAATISAWESTANAESPSPARINAYARLFSTSRSLEEVRLLSEDELTPDERSQFQELEKRLLDLLHGESDYSDESDINNGGEKESNPQASTFLFNTGPVIIVCPEAPRDAQGTLADVRNPNFAKLQQYADLDALIGIFGHIRATNPTLDVDHRLAREVKSKDISNHLVLLGGVAWNSVTKRIQDAISRVLPITQIEMDGLTAGDIFEVDEGVGEPRRFIASWDKPYDHDEPELIEDVALLARLSNPFKMDRTLTICNGIHSRGVHGAVRCLTDPNVRDTNEQYLAERFPGGRFALLLRVPVVENETVSPDLQDPEVRLSEWPSQEGVIE